MSLYTHPLFLSGMIVSLVWGVFWLPTLCWLLYPMVPKFMAQPLARLLWVFAQINYGPFGSIILYRADGTYDVFPLAETQDGEMGYVAEGEVWPLDVDPESVERFAWRPFTAGAAKDREQIERYRDDPGELPDIEADGGVQVLDEVRGGYPALHTAIPDSEWPINFVKVATEVRGSGAGELIQRAEEAEMIESGGSGDIGPVATVIGVFLCLLLGSVMSLVMLGVIP